MIKIRLRREGRKKLPFFRIVVANSTTKRNGKYLDLIGFFDPITKKCSLDVDKMYKWISFGAQKTDGFLRIEKRLMEHVATSTNQENKS